MSNGLAMPLGADGIGQNRLSATALPNFAATAWYHGKIDRKGRTLGQFYEEVTRFALSDYILALQREADQTLPTEERQMMVQRLSGYIGLPASAFDKGLAISEADFAQQLLATEGLRVSVYDSRYSAPLTPTSGDSVADDPFLSQTFPVFTGAFLDEESSKLGVDMEYPYAGIRFRDLNNIWSYARHSSWMPAYDVFKPKHYATNAEELAVAMTRNRSLYAMVVNGYYDLLMTPAQAAYTTRLAGISPDRLILEPVEAGHQPYVDAEGTRLIGDIRAMIKRASR